MMNNIYFISDIHLDPSNSEVTDKFINFMLEKSSDMKELYILGDLFEFWIDDKYDIVQNNIIISTLSKISKNGTKVFLTHGNRDFLIGKKLIIKTETQILSLSSFIILVSFFVLWATSQNQNIILPLGLLFYKFILTLFIIIILKQYVNVIFFKFKISNKIIKEVI